MQQKLVHPQEIEVFYIIPALRNAFALELKKLGKKQKEIAEILCISEPAVSQYVKEKRGAEIKFNKETSEEIVAASKRIGTKNKMLIEMQRMLILMRRNGTTCEVHRKFGQVPSICESCPEMTK